MPRSQLCCRYFNTVQSETFPVAYGSDISMVCGVLLDSSGVAGSYQQHCALQVVAAPTGSGKTGVMELAILRLISVYIDQHNQFVLKPGSLKIVYLAPIRALVQEKVKQWQQTFGSKLGLTCCELTGDTDMADGLHLDNADIICTTPEKFGTISLRTCILVVCTVVAISICVDLQMLLHGDTKTRVECSSSVRCVAELAILCQPAAPLAIPSTASNPSR